MFNVKSLTERLRNSNKLNLILNIEAVVEIKRLTLEVENLVLANTEARKTIDRLCEQIPKEACEGGGSVL